MLSNSWSHSSASQIENQLCSSERLLFTSADPEEIKSMVGRVMKPHQFNLLNPHQRLDARMHYIPMGDISLSRLRYGADVSIIPGQLQDFFWFKCLYQVQQSSKVVESVLNQLLRWPHFLALKNQQ